MELKIVTHIKEKGLADAIREFKLKSRVYENKILLKYDQIASQMGFKEVQECRGLILEKDTWKVMSLGFVKFFNAAEGHAAKIDWKTASILEKLDGTFIHVHWDWHKEKWFAATTGTAEGEGEVNNKLNSTFNSLFWDTVIEKYNFNDCLLNKGMTYMFELTTPYNIVVKPHGESSVTLIGVRNLKDLSEFSYEAMGMVAESLGVPLVKSYDLNKGNVGALVKELEGKPWFDEGFVIVDGKHNRIKVKNKAYVDVHHLKSKTSEHAIMGVVKTNEIDEFVATFPDRKEEIEKLKIGFDELTEFLEGAWEGLKEHRPKNITPQEKKRYAMEVFKVVDGEGGKAKAFSGMFFSLNEGKVDSVKEWLFNFDNKKLYNMV
jgi:hypothetical protein